MGCKSQSHSSAFDRSWPALAPARLGDGRRDDEDEGCHGRRTRDLMDVRRLAEGSGWFWECLHGWEEDITFEEKRDGLVSRGLSM